MAARKRRKNPTGALLVNPRRSNRKAKRRSNKAKAGRHVSLKHLFAAVGGIKRHSTRKRRNPLVNRRRRHSNRRRRVARRPNQTYQVMNPLINPLLNRRRRKPNRKHNRRHGRKRNALLNRRRHNRRRRNPDGLLGQIARIPVLGPIVASAVGALGGSLAGGIAAVPLYYGIKPIYGRMPKLLKPVAFSLGGSLLAAVIGAWAPSFKHKDKLTLALAVGGGAIDGYRMLSAKMGAYAGDMDGAWGFDGDGYGADDGMGDDGYGADGDGMGDDGFGDAGDVRPAEWADADLQDATYSGEDLSADEITWSGYGRAAYRKRFRKAKAGEAKHEGASEHAGKPGARWAWLIYWIGFDNFKAVAKLPEPKRKDVIHKARHAALQAARQAVSVAPDTTVESAEKAGLLAIH